MSKQRVRPSCGGRTLLPIMYGLPPRPYKDVILGGRGYMPHCPTWGCVNCGAVFRSQGEGLTPAEPAPTIPLSFGPGREGWHKNRGTLA